MRLTGTSRRGPRGRGGCVPCRHASRRCGARLARPPARLRCRPARERLGHARTQDLRHRLRRRPGERGSDARLSERLRAPWARLLPRTPDSRDRTSTRPNAPPRSPPCRSSLDTLPSPTAPTGSRFGLPTAPATPPPSPTACRRPQRPAAEQHATKATLTVGVSSGKAKAAPRPRQRLRERQGLRKGRAKGAKGAKAWR